MSQDGPASAGAILIMHIPKTAGTSLRAVVERQFPAGELSTLYPGHGPQVEELVASARARPPTAVMGHFRFGLHARLPGGGRYVTFFRDPIDQVVSHYNHLASTDDPANRGALAPGDTIEAFLRHGWARNLQTQFVTGLGPEEVEADPNAAVRLAEDVLARHFIGFGVVEWFAPSLRVLAGRLCWRVGSVPWLNRSADRRPRVTRHGLPPGVIEQIVRANACDLRLHAHASRAVAAATVPGFGHERPPRPVHSSHPAGSPAQ